MTRPSDTLNVSLKRIHVEWLRAVIEAEANGTDAFVPVLGYDEDEEMREIVAALDKALIPPPVEPDEIPLASGQ